MRTLGRIIVISITLFLLFWMVFWLMNLFSLQSTHGSPKDDTFNRYTVYWLDPEIPLIFDIPSNAVQVRIQATAVTPETETASNAANKFELGLYYHQTEQPETLWPEIPAEYFDFITPIESSGLARMERYFEDIKNRSASETLSLVLDNQPEKTIERLSLLAPAKQQMAIRISVLTERAEQEIPILWERLQNSKKVELMQEHIQPLALVSSEQIAAAMKYSWQPIGPKGVEGKDYFQSILYVDDRDLAQNTEQDHSAVIATAGPMQYYTFFQSELQQVNSFKCQPLENQSIDKQTIDWLKINFQPEDTTEQVNYPVATDEQNRYLVPKAPGLIQIESSTRCSLTFFDVHGETLNLDSIKIPTYHLPVNTPLRYPLAIGYTSPQIIRIDVRALLGDSSTIKMPPHSLEWRTVNSKNQTEKSGTIKLDSQLNPYESIVDSNFWLSQKTSHYIITSANSSHLEITSQHDNLLVRLYTRPDNLPHKIAFQLQNKQWMETNVYKHWFAIEPQDNLLLESQQRKHLVVRSPSPKTPTKENPDLLARWTDLKARGTNAKYDIFTEEQYSAENTYDSELTYWPTNKNNNSFEFSSNKSLKTFTPTLIFNRSISNPTQLLIRLDDKIVINQQISGKNGRITLPRITPGQHQLSIEEQFPGEWFVNHINSGSQRPHRIRSVYSLERKLETSVSKNIDEEWLTFLYYPATSKPHDILIAVNIQRESKQYSDFTIAQYQFEIPQQQQVAKVTRMNLSAPPIWNAIPLKVPLKADLKNRQYQITVSTSLLDSGFIQASFVNDSVTENVALSREEYNE